MTNVQAIKSSSGSKPASEVVKPAPGLVLGLDDGVLSLNENFRERAFGAEDDAFIKGAFQQLTGMAALKGKIDNAMLEFIGGALVEINPKNGLEALLASQIIANHILTMKFASQLATSEYLERTEAFERMFTKLARTTTAQVEALHKLRHGGRQKVTVEHVTVSEGGQAIIGNVDGGRG